MDTRPIGIIDSGSGGLSIWNAISTLLPHESILYVGDHAHAPYGGKTRTFIRTRVKKCLAYLIEKKQCKLIVVACNTSTVAGIDWYRTQFPMIPIVGVVPAIKTAARMTKTKNICILSTKFTAKSSYIQQLIRDFAPDATVFSLGSSKLASFIESTKNETEHIKRELSHMCNSVMNTPVDVVVLGCTHYPFIQDEMRTFFGDAVSVIDSADAVARQVARILEHNHIAAHANPTYTFFTTGNSNMVSLVMSRLTGRTIVVEPLLIP